MRRVFARTFDSLPGIVAFVDEYVAYSAIPDSYLFELNLILEELFTNMVKYAPGGATNIPVELDRQGGELRMRLFDQNVDRYDVTQSATVDVAAPLEGRTRGGLGLHLVKKLSDDFCYEYDDETRTATITVHKRIDSPEN